MAKKVRIAVPLNIADALVLALRAGDVVDLRFEGKLVGTISPDDLTWTEEELPSAAISHLDADIDK